MLLPLICQHITCHQHFRVNLVLQRAATERAPRDVSPARPVAICTTTWGLVWQRLHELLSKVHPLCDSLLAHNAREYPELLMAFLIFRPRVTVPINREIAAGALTSLQLGLQGTTTSFSNHWAHHAQSPSSVPAGMIAPPNKL